MSPDSTGEDLAPCSTTGFTIADRNYFIGLVAMLTSLRRQGHAFPMVVLDLGLTAPQREILEREFGVSLFERSEVADRHPFLLGPFAHLLEPNGLVVYLDADVIVTRPLDDMLEAAGAGKFCAFPDLVPERWFSEWAPTLALTAPMRRETYVNLGCVVFSTEEFPDLLRRWWECCADLATTVCLPAPPDQPFAYADQDVLNALLMSEVPAERKWILSRDAQPMRWRELARTKLVDTRTLACTFDGNPTAVLHAVTTPKPWQPQWRRALYASGYERCLREAVATSASAVRASETPLPLWLRPGWRGTLRWRLGSWKTEGRRRLAPVKRAVRRGLS